MRHRLIHSFEKRAALARLSLVAVLVLLQPARLGQVFQPTTNTIDGLTRQSTFVFRGTVEKTAGSTMPAVPANESTAVVRVDELIDAPGAPLDLAGKSITVKLLQTGSVRAGEQWMFFTKGWLMGNSMAVIEVGRIAATTGTQVIRAQVANTRTLIADEALVRRDGAYRVGPRVELRTVGFWGSGHLFLRAKSEPE